MIRDLMLGEGDDALAPTANSLRVSWDMLMGQPDTSSKFYENAQNMAAYFSLTGRQVLLLDALKTCRNRYSSYIN